MELYEQADSMEKGVAPIDEADFMDKKTPDELAGDRKIRIPPSARTAMENSPSPRNSVHIQRGKQ